MSRGPLQEGEFEHVIKCLLQPNFRLLIGILLIYYAIFIYDLLSVGNLESDTFAYSHATRRSEGDESSLELVYVCRHWTRALGAVLRNVVVALCWHLEEDRTVRKDSIV